MRYCVYIHTTPNSKVYIGITCQEPAKRWKNGKGYLNNDHFYSSINLYGWENIRHEIVKSGLTKEEACRLEKELIKKYDSTNREKGYNKSTGGENSSAGFHHTEEAKRKIRKAITGRKRSEKSIQATREAKSKKVKAFDMNGNLIGIYSSLTEAEKETGVNNANISATCKGRYEQCQGYIFKYADDDSPVKKTRKHRKPVAMYSLNGEYIKTFKSIKEASRDLKIADTHISDCCKGKYKQCGGYIWRYA